MTFQLYQASDISFAGGITLSNSHTSANNVSLVIDDDDNVLEGDQSVNEDGNDSNQFGTATFPNGTVVGGPNVTVYSEEHYTLTHPITGDTVRLYRIEIDSNPNSNSGAGILVGYLPEAPLDPGVTYSFFTSNTTPGNDRDYDTIDGALCFDGETLIETRDGQVEARNLTPGTWVKTLDGGFAQLRWSFCRVVDGIELRDNPNLRPICISPNALGPDRPNRPTRLSPQHKVLVRAPECELMFGNSEVLIPIKALVNGDTVHVDNSCTAVTYVHLLFDEHEIVFAHNLESESLNPDAAALTTLTPDARRELRSLLPEFVNGAKPAPKREAIPHLTVREARALAA